MQEKDRWGDFIEALSIAFGIFMILLITGILPTIVAIIAQVT